MHQFTKVMEILSKLPLPPGEQLPPGASGPDIDEAEQALGLAFPDALKEWLGLCNGPCAGPGGIFGVKTSKDFLDLQQVSDWFPAWRTKGWIPVAGDGNGNYYVLAPSGGRWPVCFVDVSTDSDVIAFVVASGLASFLIALLRKEAGLDSGWPFERAAVVAEDPGVEGFRGDLPLPWEVD